MKPLRDILLVVSGPVALLPVALANIEGVQRAVLYGSFVLRALGSDGPAPNDIDLMVVGTPDASAVYAACCQIEQSVGWPINPTILTPAELDEASGFLESVRSEPIVSAVGSWALLPRAGAPV